jgi:NAD(P)-dependent dehydrogenase (short-subunit alcohol dehydrogenase family)
VHQALIADVSILGDTRDVGARIAVEEPRIDVLINNAGNLFARRGVTAAGWCTVLTNIRPR